MPQALVLGSPIGHSLSPVLHRAAYASLGLTDWTYAACQLDEAAFPAFVAGLGADVRGLSLTMPLKEVAFTVASSVSDRARLAAAINTLLRRDDGGWDADNTDIAGIVATLGLAARRRDEAEAPGQEKRVSGARRRDEAEAPGQETRPSVAERRSRRDCPSASASPRHSPDCSPFDPKGDELLRPAESPSGLILGAGATARSALIALRELGCHRVAVCARSPEKAWASLGELAAGLDVELTVREMAAWPEVDATLVVSTLPGAGALGAAEVLRGSGRGLHGVVLLDVVYADWPTPLARAAQASGAQVVSGLNMLVHQAVEQVELMTGQRPDAQVLLAAGWAELARRSS
ncbi:MAG TPA: shikimate dehydrogenase [Tetrasphaera sp.]|uniref:shikimate dehydrogenase n=1 Tax=Nostocoides sp. TaxID=1917966 RepID=UPI002C7186AF|nr:shikimate dehydrogenase [Tetrasphaera sp.]HNQ06972.1 shikimate dehydrogenase [Tetrasphaera sp.]